VRLGIERLLEAGAGSWRRVGLLSNQAAILPDGRQTRQALLSAGFPLVRLFGPEHGFTGQAQDTVHVGDETHAGIEVISLYGERSRPDDSHLEDLDAVVIDLQDVGCRYYTYIYTAAAVMEACAHAGVEAVVCDRPNPVGADRVEGGALAPNATSEVGGYGLAQRHGLTMGEFARYLTGEPEARAGSPAPDRSQPSGSGFRKFGTRAGSPRPEATVFWMEHYTRNLLFQETGLPWKQPSPNLPSPETALLYPGTCLFEGTNVSEGRGTTRPFETIGAPWLEAEDLRDELAEKELPGVVFSVADFTPTFSTFAGEACRGIQLHVTDPRALSPLRTGIEVLLAIRRQSAERFQWRPLWQDERRSFVDCLAGTEQFRERIDAGASADEAYETACRDSEAYRRARSRALYYPEGHL
jgi:uncharacterized protein YbbC (DUF1343 family)